MFQVVWYPQWDISFACAIAHPDIRTKSADIMDSDTLHIIGLPSTPHPPKVSEVNCSSVSVTWNASRENGSPVTNYTVRYREIDNVITDSEYLPWEVYNTVDTTALLEGLQPGAIYAVSVGAENAVGESPFSDISLLVTRLPGEWVMLEDVIVRTGCIYIDFTIEMERYLGH